MRQGRLLVGSRAPAAAGPTRTRSRGLGTLHSPARRPSGPQQPVFRQAESSSASWAGPPPSPSARLCLPRARRHVAPARGRAGRQRAARRTRTPSEGPVLPPQATPQRVAGPRTTGQGRWRGGWRGWACAATRRRCWGQDGTVQRWVRPARCRRVPPRAAPCSTSRRRKALLSSCPLIAVERRPGCRGPGVALPPSRHPLPLFLRPAARFS